MVRVLGLIAAGLMGVGAVFGALNTMYTAVSARTREIATLRALGFGASPVVVSVLAESLLLALAGGLVGGGLAYLFFDGFQTSTMNWQTFSQVAFAFNVTPVLLWPWASSADFCLPFGRPASRWPRPCGSSRLGWPPGPQAPIFLRGT
jgi:putative ABC transport system permease protein